MTCIRDNIWDFEDAPDCIVGKFQLSWSYRNFSSNYTPYWARFADEFLIELLYVVACEFPLVRASESF